jgi:hypothetical protein
VGATPPNALAPSLSPPTPRYVLRDNLDETGATIWVRRGGRVD